MYLIGSLSEKVQNEFSAEYVMVVFIFFDKQLFQLSWLVCKMRA